MNTFSKQKDTGSLHQELQYFVHACEELLIAAARDLAALTQHGIGAKRIVSLSLSCERLRKLSASASWDAERRGKIRDMCRKLLVDLGKICQQADRIQEKPVRKKTYRRFFLKTNRWWLKLGMMK